MGILDDKIESGKVESKEEFNIEQFNVEDGIKLIDETDSIEKLEEYLDQELYGKDRITLVDYIQERIEELEEKPGKDEGDDKKEEPEEEKKEKTKNPFAKRRIMVNGEVFEPGDELPN